MQTRIVKLHGFLIVLITITSCIRITPQADPLSETNWTLEQLNSSPPVEGRTPTLRFSDGTVRGSSGCNSFQGKYSISRRTINFDELFMTLMACPDDDGVMEQERRFFNALEISESYELKDSSLILTTKNGTQLIFRLE
jgi:putative lipoprotein